MIRTPERMELVDRVAQLGPQFAARSIEIDTNSQFPYQNWADLADAGLLSLVIPEEAGGLGADFIGYALVSEELARHCPSTALTFNMHTATMLLTGQIADDMTLTPEHRMMLEENRAHLREGVVRHQKIHSQPFSEGQAAGATAGYSTIATPVDGGYLVNGRKIFASLSGAADFHNVVCVVEGDPRIRLLGMPAGAEGVTIEGEWDALGMRGTDSRNLRMNDVFVPAENEWIPPGLFDQAAHRWPYFYMTLSFSFLGLMRAILDDTAEYLIGDGGPGARREHPIKQQGWAEMNLLYEQAQGLAYRVLAESGVDPSEAAVRRAWASMVTTMENTPKMASIAVRVAGGRSMLRPSRIEQHYRDARCGATMLPWSVEVCLGRLGRTGLFVDENEIPA